jgi:hypothetical protein
MHLHTTKKQLCVYRIYRQPQLLPDIRPKLIEIIKSKDPQRKDEYNNLVTQYNKHSGKIIFYPIN